MGPQFRSNIVVFGSLLIFVALCIVFPRVLAFADLAARELRFFWWLALIAGIAIYISYSLGRKKR